MHHNDQSEVALLDLIEFLATRSNAEVEEDHVTLTIELNDEEMDFINLLSAEAYE